MRDGHTYRFAASKCLHDTLTAFHHSCAPVAQRLEQQTHNLLVRGSNPCGGTKENLFVDFVNQIEGFAGALNLNYLKAPSLHHSSKLKIRFGAV